MITNPDFCHTDFAPAGFHTAGHMLEVIVIEKDALQVVDDHAAKGAGQPVQGKVGAVKLKEAPNLGLLPLPALAQRLQCQNRAELPYWMAGARKEKALPLSRKTV